ncbi:hypothetical protein BC938DRAFT_480197 [Jimgerdemannia flammicorona]|uniref:Uncharacterized protein n=1 Tax=Jimgerdemannia flammicorona TaxID=994334 RepID=A0A433QJ49_9FUNG|nr:hypothetical protein BC938DRAFT_480197 [Jimgerdemannia flammicorona]
MTMYEGYFHRRHPEDGGRNGDARDIVEDSEMTGPTAPVPVRPSHSHLRRPTLACAPSPQSQ